MKNGIRADPVCPFRYLEMGEGKKILLILRQSIRITHRPDFRGIATAIDPGTVGKLLPAFYIVGKETHVGQAFEGFDPNLIASELTARIDYQTDLCDEMFGEITLPPVSLKQTDLKKQYDVQTPKTALVYYNFFVHSWSPRDVLEKLKQVAIDAFESAVMKFRGRSRRYHELRRRPYRDIDWKPRVYTYEEFYRKCREKHGQEFEQEVLRSTRNMLNQENMDVREHSLRMVEELWKWGGDDEPAVIFFMRLLIFPVWF